ncbi:hypothetical protein HUJ05_001888 [Dendroctonus ponderosae]|nr:hypothetical protein HUJ05_001888 [Dendroctonus ponderosae]
MPYATAKAADWSAISNIHSGRTDLTVESFLFVESCYCSAWQGLKFFNSVDCRSVVHDQCRIISDLQDYPTASKWQTQQSLFCSSGLIKKGRPNKFLWELRDNRLLGFKPLKGGLKYNRTVQALAPFNIVKAEVFLQLLKIYSDSQAALNTPFSVRMGSRLIQDCWDALNKVTEQKQVNLVWIPAHMEFTGNEAVDALARMS